MKCHEFCNKLFHKVFLPVIKDEFSEYLPRLSAGVFGRGSEVLGADDEFSRDHGWGPGKSQIFLPKDDVEIVGKQMAKRLGKCIPNEYLGIKWQRKKEDPVTVTTVDRVFEEETGSPKPPSTKEQWAKADENALCFARAGKVIYDANGVLSARQEMFRKAYYPESIHKWKIAKALLDIWHFGPYNSGNRLARRSDGVGLLIGQGEFVKNVLWLTFLLNKEFAPYWKWTHWRFMQLPYLSDRIEPQLQELDRCDNCHNRAESISRICGIIREALVEKELLPDNKWRNFMGHDAIMDTITDPEAIEMIRK